MKKNQTAMAELTQCEKKLLGSCLRMDKWHFEQLFTNSCSQISREVIGWERENDDSKNSPKPVTVCIYGLNAINSESKKRTIANFFIHCNYRVYQEWRIDGAVKILELIKKEFLIEQNKKKSKVPNRNKGRKLIPINKVA